MMSFFSSRGSYFVFLGFGLLRLERAREGGREAGTLSFISRPRGRKPAGNARGDILTTGLREGERGREQA